MKHFMTEAIEGHQSSECIVHVDRQFVALNISLILSSDNL